MDSTNVILPEVTTITNVAMDHAEYLGDTLEAIAGEKAGIIKPGIPIMTAETTQKIVRIFRDRADEVGAPFHRMDPAREILTVEVGPRGTKLGLETETWGPLTLETPLVGLHQARNIALAVRSLELLPSAHKPGIDAVLSGVAAVRWPGRLQVEEAPEGVWVFDVAHNVAGVRALSTSVADLGLPEPLVLLVGIQGDKDWRSMLPPLFSITREAILTQPPSVPPERRWDPLQAARAVRDRPNLHIIPDFAEALVSARRVAGSGTVLVTGSHHTVGDGMSLLGIPPYGP